MFWISEYTFSAERLFKFSTLIALSFLVSIETFDDEVWWPNNTIPLLFKWAAMCAGPVSFEIIKIESFIKPANWLMEIDLLLFKTAVALIFFESKISRGPGAVIILISL